MPSASVAALVQSHRMARREGARIGIGAGGLHADDLGGQSQQIARADGAADTGPETDRHIQRIQLRRAAEQFQRIGRDAGYQVGCEGRREFQALGGGDAGGFLARRFEIRAMLDQPRTERAHRRVLLHAVAVRHDDRHGHAVALPGIGERLPVVAARRRDDAGDIGALARKTFDIDQAAAQLEGAGWRVVLVLDPDIRAAAFAQQRPTVLRRAREARMHQMLRGFEFGESEHRDPREDARLNALRAVVPDNHPERRPSRSPLAMAAPCRQTIKRVQASLRLVAAALPRSIAIS